MHILVIEDNERVASLIQRGLEEHNFEVTLAYDGLSGKKLALQYAYDLLIVDVILPKINGIDLCKELRQSKPDLPIILLTALGTTDDKIEGFDAGADDYMVKPFEMRELIVRIQARLKRKNQAQEHTSFILQYADLELNLHSKEVKRGEQTIHLTPKEFNLLQFMMNHPERVLSRAEIAEKVWSTHFDTGTNFIDVYINYLRKKIDKGFENKLLHTKSGMGFILKLSHEN